MASTTEEIGSGEITCDTKLYEAGAGGFGDVIFGYHEVLKQHVAIKIFAVTGGPQEKSLIENRIKEEMEHLRKADHENVVRFLGYVKWHAAIGIVMEYCKGGNLKTLLLDTSKELDIAVRVQVLSEIASAMDFCHNLPDKRLIHEDLKPENVMLTEELHCKVGDFGSAELATYSASATVDPLARSNKDKIQFTLYYTAPEKLKDPAMKPTKEHDIYGFAIIIHFVLARKIPFRCLQGEQLRELLQLIKRGKRPDCQEIHEWMQTLVGEDREIVEQLEALMKRCWDQDPAKRPTMTEINDKLKKMLEKQNTERLRSQVARVVEQMDFIQPTTNESQRVPLHYFSTRTRRFEVPTRSDGTEEKLVEPAGGAQEQTQSSASQQGEIPTSSRSQQSGSTEARSNTSIETTQPKTSSVEVSREIQQPDSTRSTSAEIENLTAPTEEIPHSSTSPGQPAVSIGLAAERTEARSNTSTETTQPKTSSVEVPRPIPRKKKLARPGTEERYTAPPEEIPHSSTSPQQHAGISPSVEQTTSNEPPTEERNPISETSPIPDESDDLNQRVRKYVDLLQKKNYVQAKTTKQQISMSIEGQLDTAEDLKAEATKRKNNGEYLEAILFFNIAADFCAKQQNPEVATAETIMACAEEIEQTINILMENSDLISKSRNREIVRKHVIPLMFDITEKIRNLQIDEENRCRLEVWCLHWIGWSQDHIGDLASSEKTLKLARELMETKFGNKSSEHEVYDRLLNNLVDVCGETSRFNEAIGHFTKAIEVLTEETFTDEQRKEIVEIGEKGLQWGKAKLNK